MSLVQGWLLQVWLCKVMPSHSRPPFLGGGAVQVLFLCLTPPPHWASHSDHSVHPDQWPSTTGGHRRGWNNHSIRTWALVKDASHSSKDRPGHARGKQARLSNWVTPQAPPGRASLSMSLWRNREPRPHDTLHALQAVHGDMMQSTKGEERKRIWDMYISIWTNNLYSGESMTYHSLSHLIHQRSLSAGHTCGPSEHTPHCHSGIAWESTGWVTSGAGKSTMVWLWRLVRHGNIDRQWKTKRSIFIHKKNKDCSFRSGIRWRYRKHYNSLKLHKNLATCPRHLEKFTLTKCLCLNMIMFEYFLKVRQKMTGCARTTELLH